MNIVEYKRRFSRHRDSLKGEKIQSIAHAKKVSFLLSQFDSFLKGLEVKDEGKVLHNADKSLREVDDVVKDLLTLLGNLKGDLWCTYFMNERVTSVLMTLSQFSFRLNHATVNISPLASQSFDSRSPMWIKFHIMDLSVIKSSLSFYLDSNNPDRGTVSLFKQKILEIDTFIRENEGKENTCNFNFSVLPVNFKDNKLKHSDIKRGTKIGEGFYSIVFKGYMEAKKEYVAVKELKAKNLYAKDLEVYQRELAIISSCSHPCLLKFIGATDSYPYWIVSELLTGSSLFSDIRSKSISATDRVIAAFDIARGMKYLHSRHIIHRDLKSLNVLLDDKKRIRICDFGLSKRVDDETVVMTSNLGTPHWMAPELFSNSYDNKIDVYSYAIVMWEIAMMTQPYSNMKPPAIAVQVSAGKLRPPVPTGNGISDDYKRLMTDCWKQNPSERPSFVRILERFESEDIHIEGADRDFVKKYIHKALSSEANERDQRFLELASDLDSLAKIDSFLDFIELNSFPDERYDDVVNYIYSLEGPQPEKFLKGLVTLSSVYPDAKFTSSIRQYSNVPERLVIKLARLLPSGKDTIDEDIVITACKNNFPHLVLFKAINSSHINVILETISRTRIEKNVENVYEFCEKALVNDDLIPSALRCIASLGRISKIPQATLLKLVESPDERVSSIAKVCFAEYVTKKSDVPDYVITGYLKSCSHDPTSLLVVMSFCSNPKYAKIIGEFLKESDFYKIGKPIRAKIESRIRKSTHY